MKVRSLNFLITGKTFLQNTKRVKKRWIGYLVGKYNQFHSSFIFKSLCIHDRRASFFFWKADLFIAAACFASKLTSKFTLVFHFPTYHTINIATASTNVRIRISLKVAIFIFLSIFLQWQFRQFISFEARFLPRLIIIASFPARGWFLIWKLSPNFLNMEISQVYGEVG